MSKSREVLLDPLFNNNPIGLQVLGICSALAVTTQMWTALVMSIAVVAVIALSNLSISLIRNYMPRGASLILDDYNQNRAFWVDNSLYP